MKQLLLVGFAMALSIATPTMLRAEASEFVYDKVKVNKELAILNAADAYLTSHQATVAELRNKGILPDDVALTWSPDDATPPLGIPSVVWGFCFGILGVLLVYVMTDQSKEETKKAFYGCVAGAIFWVILNVIFNVIL